MALHQINTLQIATPRLSISLADASIQIQWEGAGGMLQSAGAPDGPWSDLQAYSGNQVSILVGDQNRFYRLHR